jgi:hypothetical protein
MFSGRLKYTKKNKKKLDDFTSGVRTNCADMAGGWEGVDRAKGGTASGTELGKQGGTDEAATVQANRTWLVSGTTLTLNFLRKSMPKMGPATAACKKKK